jgi:hypothetical protein
MHEKLPAHRWFDSERVEQIVIPGLGFNVEMKFSCTFSGIAMPTAYFTVSLLSWARVLPQLWLVAQGTFIMALSAVVMRPWSDWGLGLGDRTMLSRRKLRIFVQKSSVFPA